MKKLLLGLAILTTSQLSSAQANCFDYCGITNKNSCDPLKCYQNCLHFKRNPQAEHCFQQYELLIKQQRLVESGIAKQKELQESLQKEKQKQEFQHSLKREKQKIIPQHNEEEMDEDLRQAIELSKQQPNISNQSTSNEDLSFEEQMQLAKQRSLEENMPQNIENLSEEEQLQLALQESMKHPQKQTIIDFPEENKELMENVYKTDKNPSLTSQNRQEQKTPQKKWTVGGNKPSQEKESSSQMDSQLEKLLQKQREKIN
jgi:hypothetical protein